MFVSAGLLRSSGGWKRPSRNSRRWRPRPESNRGARICSPLRNHSATRPRRDRLSMGDLLTEGQRADKRPAAKSTAVCRGCRGGGKGPAPAARGVDAAPPRETPSRPATQADSASGPGRRRRCDSPAVLVRRSAGSVRVGSRRLTRRDPPCVGRRAARRGMARPGPAPVRRPSRQCDRNGSPRDSGAGCGAVSPDRDGDATTRPCAGASGARKECRRTGREGPRESSRSPAPAGSRGSRPGSGPRPRRFASAATGACGSCARRHGSPARSPAPLPRSLPPSAPADRPAPPAVPSSRFRRARRRALRPPCLPPCRAPRRSSSPPGRPGRGCTPRRSASPAGPPPLPRAATVAVPRDAPRRRPIGPGRRRAPRRFSSGGIRPAVAGPTADGAAIQATARRSARTHERAGRPADPVPSLLYRARAGHLRPALPSPGKKCICRLASRKGVCYRHRTSRALFPGSSVVEQPAVNRLVAGSNPARGANFSNDLTRHRVCEAIDLFTAIRPRERPSRADAERSHTSMSISVPTAFGGIVASVTRLSVPDRCRTRRSCRRSTAPACGELPLSYAALPGAAP